MFWKKKPEPPKYVVVDCAFNCIKDKCPKWVILNHRVTQEDGAVKDVPEGKCAIAWLPTLLIELKEALAKKE